jgi:hypothetical protein
MFKSKLHFFYTITQGETERDIFTLNFEHTHIFEPSMIAGNRKERRSGEKIFMKVFTILNPLLVAKLAKYKGIGNPVSKALNLLCGKIYK